MDEQIHFSISKSQLKKIVLAVAVLVIVAVGAYQLGRRSTSRSLFPIIQLPKISKIALGNNVWMEADPTQCETSGTWWEASNWFKENMSKYQKCTDDDIECWKEIRLESKKDFFEFKGITIYQIKELLFEELGKNPQVSLSCDSPGGSTLFLLVSKNDAQILEEYGFKSSLGPTPILIQPTSITTSYSNWQIYSNEFFVFQYPPDMTITSSIPDTVIDHVGVGKIGPTQKASGRTRTEIWDGVSFSVYQWSASEMSAFERIKKEYDFLKTECTFEAEGSGITNIANITVGSYNGYQFVSSYCRGNKTHTTIDKDGFVFEIIQSYGDVKDYMDEYKTITEDIMNTFKFQ